MKLEVLESFVHQNLCAIEVCRDWNTMGVEQESPKLAASSVIEKRQHTRYRFIERLFVRTKTGSYHSATTFEISFGGLSAATTGILGIGENVELSPVVGEKVNAIVRRKQGAMYGFQFIDLSPTVSDRIRKLCEELPEFRTMVNI